MMTTKALAMDDLERIKRTKALVSSIKQAMDDLERIERVSPYCVNVKSPTDRYPLDGQRAMVKHFGGEPARSGCQGSCAVYVEHRQYTVLMNYNSGDLTLASIGKDAGPIPEELIKKALAFRCGHG